MDINTKVDAKMGVYQSDVSRKQSSENPVVKQEVYTGRKLYEREFNGWMFYTLGGLAEKDKIVDDLAQLSCRHSDNKMNRDTLVNIVSKVLHNTINKVKEQYVKERIISKNSITAYQKTAKPLHELFDCVKAGDISTTEVYRLISQSYHESGCI
ncbi:MAG: hypothetical protein U9R34_05890 [Nanoarchaeota archaeon]|nr:hypothetical protein [Nanoarchaeota archaeon]